MSQRHQIAAFIDILTHHDGFPPFSDAKVPIDPDSRRAVIIAEKGDVMAIGAAASHLQPDGSLHKGLETATLPGMRFPAFEGAVLEASLPLVENADSYSVWSARSSLDAALEDRGFPLHRVLEFLTVDLPIARQAEASSEFQIRTFVPPDIEGIIATNREAFDGHREAAGMDTAEMARYLADSWFNARGLFIAEQGGIAGFCWTRVHPDGDGEIFRIAVSPAQQGSGLGMALLQAGFDYLATLPEVRRGVLWFDASNSAAANLYRSIGMERVRSNREFVPS